MDALVQDLRFAARTLRRSAGFTAVAVLTLALGIGANTAIFSAVHSVLLRPLPTPELDRVVVVRQDVPGLAVENAELAAAEVEDLAARTETFEAVAGLRPLEWNLTGYGEPLRVAAALTHGDFFALFRVRPHLGSLYTAENSLSGEHEVVVLSYGAWQQLAGGDPGIIGRSLELDGAAREVIGVLPPEFRFPRGVQIFKPLNFTPALREQRQRWNTTVVARLQPGVTHEQLASQLAAEVARQDELYHGGGPSGKVLHATPLVEYLAGPLRLVLLVLTGAVGLVLLIACANVASLQLVRAAARAREIAVRTAIGASRARIVRQLLVESLVLALLGGALGLLVARAALVALAWWDPAQRLALEGVQLNTTVLGFAALVSLLAAMLFGLAPALRASRLQPQQAIRAAGAGASADRSRQRFLNLSVVGQLALALVLLVGSGLLLQSLARLLETDPGLRAERLVTAQIALPGSRYREVPERAEFFGAVLERLEGIPGIEAAGAGWALPFSDQMRDASPFEITGRPAEPGEPERHAEYRVVGGSYFQALGIPLLRGRTFAPSDHLEAPPVALIDERFARQFFAGEDPIGREITHAYGPVTIVGVVGSVHHGDLAEVDKPVAYYHYGQAWTPFMALAVRSSLDPAVAVAALRTAVREQDPNIPLYDVATMEQRIRHSLGDRRLAAAGLGVFATVALLLAVLGVYGVMRYSTNQRTREIGIRMALGAQGGEVVRMVVRQGLAITALGITLGVVAAFILTRLMSGMLYGISARDPLTFALVPLVLAGIAIVAAYLPARRAAQVDPMVALRTE